VSAGKDRKPRFRQSTGVAERGGLVGLFRIVAALSHGSRSSPYVPSVSRDGRTCPAPDQRTGRSIRPFGNPLNLINHSDLTPQNIVLNCVLNWEERSAQHGKLLGCHRCKRSRPNCCGSAADWRARLHSLAPDDFCVAQGSTPTDGRGRWTQTWPHPHYRTARRRDVSRGNYNHERTITPPTYDSQIDSSLSNMQASVFDTDADCNPTSLQRTGVRASVSGIEYHWRPAHSEPVAITCGGHLLLAFSYRQGVVRAVAEGCRQPSLAGKSFFRGPPTGSNTCRCTVTVSLLLGGRSRCIGRSAPDLAGDSISLISTIRP
jgi:hypothetical protein